MAGDRVGDAAIHVACSQEHPLYSSLSMDLINPSPLGKLLLESVVLLHGRAALACPSLLTRRFVRVSESILLVVCPDLDLNGHSACIGILLRLFIHTIRGTRQPKKLFRFLLGAWEACEFQIVCILL